MATEVHLDDTSAVIETTVPDRRVASDDEAMRIARRLMERDAELLRRLA
jgi:hypothetical protein